jgi:hypothetical protein
MKRSAQEDAMYVLRGGDVHGATRGRRSCALWGVPCRRCAWSHRPGCNHMEMLGTGTCSEAEVRKDRESVKAVLFPPDPFPRSPGRSVLLEASNKRSLLSR